MAKRRRIAGRARRSVAALALAAVPALAAHTDDAAPPQPVPGGDFIACRARFDMPPEAALPYWTFAVVVQRTAEGGFKSTVDLAIGPETQRISNDDVQVLDESVRADFDLEDRAQWANRGEAYIAGLINLMSDTEAQPFKLELELPFDPRIVRRLRFFELEPGSFENKYGGIQLVEAYDAQGRLLARMLHSGLYGPCR